jgi:hypothetical protein
MSVSNMCQAFRLDRDIKNIFRKIFSPLKKPKSSIENDFEKSAKQMILRKLAKP